MQLNSVYIYLFFLCCHQGNGQAHPERSESSLDFIQEGGTYKKKRRKTPAAPFSPSHSANSVDVVLLLIRQGDIYN